MASSSIAIFFWVTLIMVILCGSCIFFFVYYKKKLLRLQEIIIQKQNESEIATKKEVAYVLHEEIAKQLTFIQWNTRKVQAVLEELPSSADTDEMMEYLASTQQQIEDAQVRVRELHQFIYPPTLRVLSFSEACEALIVELQKNYSGKIHCSITGSPDNLPEIVAFNLYGLVNLFVTNSIKHSQAKNIRVRLSMSGTYTSLLMTDDGTGFDMDDSLKKASGRGLFDIKSRAIAISPTHFSYYSVPERGTELEIRI